MSTKSFILKKEWIIISILSAILVIPRIILFFVLGSGLISTDGQMRYIPQAEQLAQSFSYFFTQIGPLYSAILMIFEKITGDIVSGPIILQHALGVITAILVFFFFKKINLSLAISVTLIVFAGMFSLFIEHWLLREALAAFLLISMVYLVTLSAKETKYMRFTFGLLTGLTGLLLYFTRIEFIGIIIMVPVILFISKKSLGVSFKIKSMAFWKWTGGYYLLSVTIIITIIIANMFTSSLSVAYSPYGSFSGITYYYLKPSVFDYKDSQYPELLSTYQLKANRSGDSHVDVNALHESIQEYLLQKPEISISDGQLMDRLFLEAASKNPLTVLWSISTNLGNHLMGQGEAEFLTQINIKMGNLSLVEENGTIAGVTEESNQTTEKTGILWQTINLISQAYSTIMGLIYRVLNSAIFAWLLIPSLILMFVKWKNMPIEIIISFLICFTLFGTLALLANPVHRFRYPADPLMYFLQLYLIYLMLKPIVSRLTKFVQNRLHPDEVS